MSNPFEAARTRATQRATADLQQNQDALKRRFAALGGLNSGAAIKQQQLLQERSQQQREEAIQGIDAAEADRHENQVNRDFQAGEAEKQRGFQREQAGIDRGFQDKVFSFEKESKLKQLDLAAQQFSFDKEQTLFNRKMALAEQFGGGGLFGIGKWSPEEAGFELSPQQKKAQQTKPVSQIAQLVKRR
jgi:hypothetical protein